MLRALFAIILLLAGIPAARAAPAMTPAGMSLPGAPPGIGGGLATIPNTHGQVVGWIATPDHNALFDQSFGFGNLNDCADFFGTTSGDGKPEYISCQGFFSGYSSGNAELFFTRSPVGGGRARGLGAVLEQVPVADGPITTTDTTCKIGQTYCALGAIQALGGSTITIGIGGTNVHGVQTVTATLPTLSGDSWAIIASTIQTYLNAAAAATPYAAIVGQVTPASCQVSGIITAGFMTVTSATGGTGVGTPSSNCYQEGGLLNCTNLASGFPCNGGGFPSWIGQLALGQVSGTPGGAGVHAVWLDNFAQNYALQNNLSGEPAAWQENWGVLTITSVGASGIVSVGDALYGTGLAGNSTGASNSVITAYIGGAASIQYYNGIAYCQGAGCAGAEFALSNDQNETSVPSSGTETMTSAPCPFDLEANAYTGVVNDYIRIWPSVSAYCPYWPAPTLTWATGTAAHTLGLDLASARPASPVSWPYGGASLSFQDEVLGVTPGMTSYAQWLELAHSTIIPAATVVGLQIDPDLGLVVSGTVTPTYKNAVTSFYGSLGDANIPVAPYQYFRVGSEIWYPFAANNTSVPPSCTPAPTRYTSPGVYTYGPDWCPVHTIGLIGSGGCSTNGLAGGIGVGAPGSPGASASAEELTQVTSDSGGVIYTFTVDSACGGLSTKIGTAPTGILFSSAPYAFSGGNATAPTAAAFTGSVLVGNLSQLVLTANPTTGTIQYASTGSAFFLHGTSVTASTTITGLVSGTPGSCSVGTPCVYALSVAQAGAIAAEAMTAAGSIAGTTSAQTCPSGTYTFPGGAITCASGVGGAPPNSDGGVGAPGGTGSATFINAGKKGGNSIYTGAGGGGGTGTGGVGCPGGTTPLTGCTTGTLVTSGGAAGANNDGTPGGAGQNTAASNGNSPGGAGSGTSVASTNSGNGAPGWSGTGLVSLFGAGGFGQGGGGGAAADGTISTTTPQAGNGGLAGNYGASGGPGGGSSHGTPGAAGSSAGGFAAIVSAQDH
jgi:hypothetical protein